MLYISSGTQVKTNCESCDFTPSCYTYKSFAELSARVYRESIHICQTVGVISIRDLYDAIMNGIYSLSFQINIF